MIICTKRSNNGNKIAIMGQIMRPVSSDAGGGREKLKSNLEWPYTRIVLFSVYLLYISPSSLIRSGVHICIFEMDCFDSF